VLIISCLFSGLYLAQAQRFIEFTPETQFPIPENNGNINFLVNGTYLEAELENNSWIFKDLHLSTSTVTMPLLNVSVQDCNITIRSISRFSSLQSSGTLRYNLTGQGTQTFNFNLAPKEREWSVIYDGEFTPEGRGWHLGNDETVIVTRQAINITVYYMDFPEDIVESSNLPIYQSHSAIIFTGAVAVIAVIIAVTIQTKKQKNSNAEVNT
jgi:hypothetical protein